MAGLIKRGKGTYHFRMRVPKKFLPVAGKTEIHRSLKTDSLKRAAELVPAVRAEILAELKALLLIQQQPDSSATYNAAQQINRSKGLSFLSLKSLLEAPIEETLLRLESISEKDGVEVARALLGGVEKPKADNEDPGLRLSGLVDEIETIKAHDLRYKNRDQLRVWRSAKKRAVNNLIAAMGGKDLPITKVDNAAALKHKAWWQQKIADSIKKGDKPLSIDTANKDFSHMAGMLRDYYEHIAYPDAPKPYERVGIKDRHQEKKRKPEVPLALIEEKWLAPEAFDGLNDEARDIALISLETGCRQSEIFNLPPNAIVLDAPIPHLRIELEEGEHCREIKNLPSARLIPLVGLALAAAKRHPNGFPRYRGKGSYSNTVNEFFRSRDLLPPKGITLGGLRHTFESRLKNRGYQSDDRGEMMGHSLKEIRAREVYGDSMTLEAKHQVLSQIALHVPAHLE